MAKSGKILSILVVLLVVLALSAQAQKQNQQSGKRQKVKQKEQQHLQESQPGPKPIPTLNRNESQDKSHKRRVKVQKHRYITQEIPELGRVRGRASRTEWSDKTIKQFLDIPYAKAPVGALRFKPPQPREPWQGVLDAYKSHVGCPSSQDLYNFETWQKKKIDFEDCLRLSVSSKSLNGNAPVMVYIHGDFLYEGSSAQANPGYLLEEDIVLVSIRYRLGPFGFLSTMSEDIPGNAAVHDVILALKWIQKHITAFGGDPTRVTLFGQVGGSAIINVLTMSPAVPDGLFHRVIYQSGTALTPAFITDNPLPSTKDIAKHAGCQNLNKDDALNKCLRNLNTTALLTAFGAHGDAKAHLGIGNYGAVQFVIGGPSGILPKHPAKILDSEDFKAYPTLGGSVKNAGTFILKDIFIDNFNETIMDDHLDGIGYIDYVVAQTNGPDPEDAWRQFAQEEIFTDEEIKNGTFHKLLPGLIDMSSTIPFKNPILLTLQANARKLANSTYLYSFDYEGELNRYASSEDIQGLMPFELGVSLTDDNLYIFPWPRHRILNSNRDIKIAKRMVAFWSSFATNGVPTAPNTPAWPALTEETGPYLKIGKTLTIGENYLEEYNIAVKEARLGYSMVNEEFFKAFHDIAATEKDLDNVVADLQETQENDGDVKETSERELDFLFIASKAVRLG